MAGEMENKAIGQLEVEVEVEVGAWQKLHTKKKGFSTILFPKLNLAVMS